MDRDLTIGLVFALAMHSVVMWWGVGMQRAPRPPEVREEAVRTVREQVALPKPPPPPVPPPPVPEAKPEPAQQAATAPQPQPATAPKTRPVRANKPRSEPVAKPSDEPPPLVLSQTYGDSSGPGVAVNKGDDDVLGDPDVAPTESNVRRRQEPKPKQQAGPGGEGAGGTTPQRRVEIAHAVPKTRCNIEWPEGAEAGNRTVEVRLTLEISTGGQVISAKVLRGAGEPFDSAALAAMRACAFKPGLRDGVPFVDRVPFAVEFKSNGR